MKRIVLILLLSFAYVAQAQYLAPMNAKNSGSWSVGLLRIDSSFNLRLFDTAVTKLAFPSNLNNRWARQGQRLYIYNGSFFELADNVPAIDTTSLSTRINARVKYTDTASMLVGYVRAARLNDTALAIRSSIPNVSGKVNYTDTAAMLSPYLRKADTTAMLSKYLRKSDTTAMLLPYARKTLVNDTAAAIRAAIPNVSGKVNYSDTASMLAPYYRTATATAALALKQNITDTTTWDATKKNLADTALALRALIPSAIDTTSLSNRIDARLKYTDTASMLAPYATDAQVALKLNIVDTANMRIRPIAGSNMTITGTYPNVTFAASGGTVIDTTSLSNRIDARVKYTDTASMLAPYLRSAAAATTYVPYTGATTNVNLGEYQASVGQITLDQTPTQTAGVGVLRWNDSDGTADLGLKGGNVTLQIGQEEVVRVVNKTGANLLESQYHAVYVTGAQGQRLKIGNALATSDTTSAATIGLVTENINLNEEGFITTNGLVRNINTTGSLQGETWNDGDLLFLSGTTAGQITNIKPIAPTHTIIIGYVVYAHAVNGKIFVKVDNGYELDELHNVRIVSAANNQGLFYDSAAKLWENKSIATVLGYTPANNASVVKYADTSAMLSSYLRKVDTASLSTRIDTKLNSADTASLSTRIDARVKYSDTATMLSSYYRTATATAALATKVNYTDTATMLSPYYRTATATAALATKVNYTDTATMLTPYLRKGDTASMLATYAKTQRLLDTAAAIQTRLDLEAPIASPTFTGTVTIPTGANITTPNILSLTSGTTNDSIVVADATSGALRRISSSRIGGGGGSGWGLTGNAGTTFPTNFLGTTDNVDLTFRRNNNLGGRLGLTNTSFGDSSLRSLSSGTNNTAFGVSSLKTISTQSNNTAIGYNALQNTTGSGNIAIGATAATGLSSGSNCIAIGIGVGAGTSGSKNITITNSGTIPNPSSSSQLNLGNVLWGSACTGTGTTAAGSLSIGVNAPNASALLDLTSTTKGLLLPRMTTTEINAIASPAAGLTVYNTTLALICFYNGTTWQRVTAIPM